MCWFCKRLSHRLTKEYTLNACALNCLRNGALCSCVLPLSFGTNPNIPKHFHICDVMYLNAKLLFIMQMIGLYFSRVPTVTQRWALMFGSLYFLLINYHQCCQVINAGTDVSVCVCVCVCVCALWRNHFNCFLIPAESTLNTYFLINNASLYKGLRLFMRLYINCRLK